MNDIHRTFKKGKSISTAMLFNYFWKAKYSEEQFVINNMVYNCIQLLDFSLINY